jgi:XTP/dITP diphosphohydrolase
MNDTPYKPHNAVLIATRNPGKAAEFAEMLSDDNTLGWCNLSNIKTATVDVEETGHTFRANACIKASSYAQQTGLWTIADDSGLEVDALNGSPGVVSARWAELHAQGKGDADNNRLLLSQLQHVPDAARTARFVCVLALADARGRVMLTVRDSVQGHIVREPRGTNGFGYDPLFELRTDDAVIHAKTTAELTAAQKHLISHRGRALVKLKQLIGPTMRTIISGMESDR